MNVLIVHAHPEPTSFNAALTGVAVEALRHAGHEVTISDLYAEDFDPRVLSADLLILQFPLWWGAPPAIVKGWFDRVLAYGVAYVDGRRFTSGVFKGRRALLSVTTGGPQQRFRPEDVYGDIEQVLWPVRRLVLEYMGYEVERPFVSYAAPRVTPEERAAYLAAWRERVLASASLPVTTSPLDPRALIASIDPAAWKRSS